MSKYDRIILFVFQRHYRAGMTSFQFDRQELAEAAMSLSVTLPKNLGDLVYSYRFRKSLPKAIRDTAPEGKEWIIRLAGRGQYKFALSALSRIVPSKGRYVIKIPDATPEIIRSYAQTDEQALLARVRYNRLIDIFLGITAYSLQNHLRTTVPNIGQIEIDELYVGVRSSGEQFVVPVQAKGRSDMIGIAQLEQDYFYCQYRYPELTTRQVAVQFMDEKNVIAMFEVLVDEGDDAMTILDEKHYRLVPHTEIRTEDLQIMASRTG